MKTSLQEGGNYMFNMPKAQLTQEEINEKVYELQRLVNDTKTKKIIRERTLNTQYVENDRKLQNFHHNIDQLK